MRWGGCGSVFRLRVPPTAPRTSSSLWDLTVLYHFTGGSDGGGPQDDLAFDSSGNIYGTAGGGGDNGTGVIYELSRSGSGWAETVLYSAPNCDRCSPSGGVVFDNSGNLYGVFYMGGPYGYGAVYELSPSESGWTEQTVYGFTGGSDGQWPNRGTDAKSVGQSVRHD